MTKLGHKSGTKKKQQYRSVKGTYASKLTPKQKAFADRRLAHKKESLTESAYQTYNITDRRTASVVGAQNMTNPSILLYLEQNKDKAQLKITELIDSDNERIALDASKETLDRTVGKPTQRTEVRSEHLHLSLDLTGED